MNAQGVLPVFSHLFHFFPHEYTDGVQCQK